MHAAERGTPNSGIRCPIKRIRRSFEWQSLGKKKEGINCRQVRQRINDWKTDAGQGLSYPLRRVFPCDTCAVTREFLRCHPSDSRSSSVYPARRESIVAIYISRFGSALVNARAMMRFDGAPLGIMLTHELRIASFLRKFIYTYSIYARISFICI